jgi:hypothetical protein
VFERLGLIRTIRSYGMPFRALADYPSHACNPGNPWLNSVFRCFAAPLFRSPCLRAGSTELTEVSVVFLTAEYAEYAKAGGESPSISFPRIWRIPRFPSSNFNLLSLISHLRSEVSGLISDFWISTLHPDPAHEPGADQPTPDPSQEGN